MGRPSAGTKRAREQAGEDGDITITVVQSGAKAALSKDMHCLLPFFHRASDSLGIHHHLAGLIAQSYALNVLREEEETFELKSASSYKTFFDNIFSAFDNTSMSRREGTVGSFAHSWCQERRVVLWGQSPPTDGEPYIQLPMPVSFQMRDAASAEMARNVKLHIDTNFYLRRVSYVKRWIVHAIIEPSAAGAAFHNVNVELTKGGFVSKVIACIDNSSSSLAPVRTAINAVVANVSERTRIFANARLFIDGERQVQEDFPDEATPTFRRLYHSRRFSNFATRWRQRYLISGDDDQATIIAKKARLSKWNAANVSIPKPAMLFPHFKFKRRMVKYSATALIFFFSKFIPAVLAAESNGGFAVGRYPQQPDALPEKLQSIVDAMTPFGKKSPYNAEAAADFFKTILRLKHFGGKNQRVGVSKGRGGGLCYRETDAILAAPLVWHITDFSTNGIQLNVTFSSGLKQRARNVDVLNEAGFNFPDPDGGRVNVASMPRGILRDHQLKHQAVVREADEGKVELTSIDLGVLKPIEAVTIPYKDAAVPERAAKYVAENFSSASFSNTQAEWKKESGALDLEAFTAAKNAKPLYAAYMEAVVQTRRVSARYDYFDQYVQVQLEHFDTLVRYNLSRHQSLVNWHANKKAMHALAKLADKISRTTREDNREAKRLADLNEPPLPKRIVVVGDGSFGCSFPRKKFVRLLAARGPVVIEDEFNTSKRCLCGQVLVDDPDQQATATGRPRRHTTDASDQACFAMRSFRDNGLVFGRDCVSSCSIACCAAAGMSLRGAGRPDHFCSAASMNAWRKKCI